MIRHALLAAGACVVLGAAAQAPAPTPRLATGYSFTITTIAEPGGTSTTKVKWLDGVARFDSEDPSGKEAGGYVLVNTKERSAAMVMPGSKNYIQMKFDSTAGVIMQAAAMNSYVTDIEVSPAALGSGGIVNGQSTRKYRMTTSFKTADNSSGDRTKMRSVKMVEEFWVADQLKDIPDPRELFARAFGGKVNTGGEKLPQMQAGGLGAGGELFRKRSEAQLKLFKGMPVRTKWTNVEEFDGKTVETAGQSDITDIQKADMSPADFQVPAGYTKLDMQSLEGMKSSFKDALRSGGKAKADGAKDAASGGAAEKDTTSIIDAAKDGAKEAGKEAAKDAAKDALKKKVFGRFKKP